MTTHRRKAYGEKLRAHKLIMRKLDQLTRRLPQPDDAEVNDIVVLNLIEGRIDNIVQEWSEFMEANS